jgi:hypothetical protein
MRFEVGVNVLEIISTTPREDFAVEPAAARRAVSATGRLPR